MQTPLTERGHSYADCCQRIVEKYGIYYNVLQKRTIPSRLFGIVPEKVEVIFSIPSYGFKPGSPMQGPPIQGVPLPGAAAQVPGEQTARQYSRTGRDSASFGGASFGGPSEGGGTTLDFVEAKKRVLAAAGKDPEQIFQQVQEEKEAEQLILEKLQLIDDKLETRNEAPKSEHPSITHIAQVLRDNDFSERYINGILKRVRKDLSLETLENIDAVQDQVLLWIGESIKIFPIPQRPKSGRILVLIGPTGVGKTTTIAKLAAVYGIENSGRRPLSVRMITIDAFRIGAGKQIEAYGDIMEIPVSYIDNHRDLRREIDLYRDETDLFLIDTIGRSPKDSSKLGEMKELLDACGSKAEIHLALSASTKTSDMEHILQQFEPFNYQAVLLTKLDETRRVGNVISALAEKGKPLSYVTDGQIVPKDIKKASVVRFLINLEEFRVDREKIEKLFSAAEADQFQWG